MILGINKITKSTDETKLISVISVVAFLFAFVIFAYAFALESGSLGIEGEKTFTISKALANGNKAGVIIFSLISFYYLLDLIRLRGPKKFLIWRYFLILLAYSLVISLLWFTPTFNKNLHNTLAAIIFVFLFIYQMLTYYLILKTYQKDYLFFYTVMTITFLAFIALITFAIIRGETGSDIFAAFEIAFSFLFLFNTLILGFY